MDVVHASYIGQTSVPSSMTRRTRKPRTSEADGLALAFVRSRCLSSSLWAMVIVTLQVTCILPLKEKVGASRKNQIPRTITQNILQRAQWRKIFSVQCAKKLSPTHPLIPRLVMASQPFAPQAPSGSSPGKVAFLG